MFTLIVGRKCISYVALKTIEIFMTQSPATIVFNMTRYQWRILFVFVFIEVVLVLLDMTFNRWQWAESGAMRLFNTTRETGSHHGLW